MTQKDRIGIDIALCHECHERDIAMSVARRLNWRTYWRERIIGFDNETNEITVSEQGLLKIIQMINPIQTTRRLRLVDETELEQKETQP